MFDKVVDFSPVVLHTPRSEGGERRKNMWYKGGGWGYQINDFVTGRAEVLFNLVTHHGLLNY